MTLSACNTRTRRVLRQYAALLSVLAVTSCTPRDDGHSVAEVYQGSARLLYAESAALEAETILSSFRGGDERVALESLEGGIDSAVCRIWDLSSDAPERDRQRAMTTLRIIRAYRQKYPRQLRLSHLDGHLADAVRKTSRRASSILGEVGDGQDKMPSRYE